MSAISPRSGRHLLTGSTTRWANILHLLPRDRPGVEWSRTGVFLFSRSPPPWCPAQCWSRPEWGRGRPPPSCSPRGCWGWRCWRCSPRSPSHSSCSSSACSSSSQDSSKDRDLFPRHLTGGSRSRQASEPSDFSLLRRLCSTEQSLECDGNHWPNLIVLQKQKQTPTSSSHGAPTTTICNNTSHVRNCDLYQEFLSHLFLHISFQIYIYISTKLTLLIFLF